MTTLDDAQKQGIVIGLKGVTNESRDRLDVDELLLKYPKTFNLFLLALVELQDEAKSNNDKMGWFQIAGRAIISFCVELLSNPKPRHPWTSAERLGWCA